MDREYDIERMGRKMPFSMPENFFCQMQANVLAKVREEEMAKHHRKAMIRRMYVAVGSVAACACLVLVLGFSFFGRGESPKPAVNMASVDKVYDSLSAEEQQELNATYANDVYLSME